MKIRAALILVSMLLGLGAGTAGAEGNPSQGRLDRSFGHSGLARVRLPEGGGEISRFRVGPDGRTYVLYHSSLFAFGSDGRLDREFGGDGRVTTDPAGGVGRTVDFALDSEGRILVAGVTHPPGRQTAEAYVLRLLPSGARDVGFGDDGEVDTTFGLPSKGEEPAPNVRADSIVVDAYGRLLVGGSFGEDDEVCGYQPGESQAPFVARLTSEGAIDESFGDSGHAVLEVESGSIRSLALAPAGSLGVFAQPCSGPPRFESRGASYTVLDENGATDPRSKERGFGFSYLDPMIDSRGRIVELESPPPAAEEVTSFLARFLPDGARDRSFGRGGKATTRSFEAFAIDAEDRVITSPGFGKIELRRFLPDGRIDKSFGPGGRLTAKGAEPHAIGFDDLGRIYTASLVEKRSHTTIAVARFIPGR